ncbi:beta-N-acetylhexosaminidase [Amycolatopsis antarctica]|uniref:beta-N-acetylhexosaminidase n=1 Tax=Amycolatopsis antarctica TaxID=1854586 RepID=A0A263D4T8_9PSEU|nr:beta-N-acetylhexosaminidase [Amycolatopsis antarctica]
MVTAFALCLPLAGIGGATASAESPAAVAQLGDVVPVPVEVTPDPAGDFTLTPGTAIHTQPGSEEAAQVGEYLAGFLPKSRIDAGGHGRNPKISLLLESADERVGEQGYQLDVAKSGVTIRANTADGLFSGVQTLRQYLPTDVAARQGEQVATIPGGSVVDHPRYGYRSAMLDVARHFHPVDEVKRYIDNIAQYKINTLHLHLADDQGWRLEIKKWPRLTEYGGSTEVGGGEGGFYTQEQFSDLVAYAASRHITIVPEIDMPGHTNAALASYAELNCDGVAPPLYTGIEVGFSSLCVDKDITYQFVDDVLGELAAITPGEYLHIGGDEAHATTEEDYRTFMGKVLPLVEKHGKKVTGWHEIAQADLPASAVPQYWGTEGEDADLAEKVAAGTKVLVSPANKTYLDMKYDENTPVGLSWAGLIEVQTAYDWDPATAVAGVGEESITGVEAPMWTETIETREHIDLMSFPRLPAIAEIGWSQQADRNWDTFRTRLAMQGPRLEAQGIGFYRSPQVEWPG